jgi:hypothetical protein
LSLGQLAKPYSRAMTSCASASEIASRFGGSCSRMRECASVAPERNCSRRSFAGCFSWVRLGRGGRFCLMTNVLSFCLMSALTGRKKVRVAIEVVTASGLSPSRGPEAPLTPVHTIPLAAGHGKSGGTLTDSSGLCEHTSSAFWDASCPRQGSMLPPEFVSTI